MSVMSDGYVGTVRFEAYASDVETVARRLLGQRLVRIVDRQRLAGTIVETEAYPGGSDVASHSYNGRRTPRNESMYLEGGHAYVYVIYGLHHCLNVVTGNAGEGAAVLIRAIEPTDGIERMWRNRSERGVVRSIEQLCAGPGRICQAMAIDRTFDGFDLRTGNALWIERTRKRALRDSRIERTPRIGVQYAGDWAARRLRFVVRGSPYISR